MKIELRGRIVQVGNDYGNPAVKIWLNPPHEREGVDGVEDDEDLPVEDEFLSCDLSEEMAIVAGKSLYEDVRITIEAVRRPVLVKE